MKMKKEIKKRGFANMDHPEKQKAIASKGGTTAHRFGTAHQWTSDEAKIAGSIGGKKVSANIEHMREIGKRGGAARGKLRKVEQDAK